MATKQKQPLFESGIAYFAYPSLLGRECQEHPFESAFDGDFGHGFTTMMTAMMRAVRESSLAAGLPLPPPVGLHVGQRRQLGYLDFGFMLMGPQVVCLKTCLYPDHDPAWPMMRETGISTVFHLPCQPAAIESALLPLAKSPGENAAKVLPQPGLLATEQPRPPSA